MEPAIDVIYRDGPEAALHFIGDATATRRSSALAPSAMSATAASWNGAASRHSPRKSASWPAADGVNLQLFGELLQAFTAYHSLY
jgi:hypothetical protein